MRLKYYAMKPELFLFRISYASIDIWGILFYFSKASFFSRENISPGYVLAHTTHKHEYAEAERDTPLYIMSPPHKLRICDNSQSPPLLAIGNKNLWRCQI